MLAKPVRQLSLGERMRCEIIASLLHAPDVLFLDEPTIGLDVTAKAVIRDLIRDQSEREGRTLLFTSHDTGDMESVCDRVIVIHRGRVLLDRPTHALRRSYIARKRVTVMTAEESIDIDLPGVRVLERRPHRTELDVDLGTSSVERVVQHVLRETRLQDLTVEDPPMEEIVQAIYARAEASAPPTGTPCRDLRCIAGAPSAARATLRRHRGDGAAPGALRSGPRPWAGWRSWPFCC